MQDGQLDANLRAFYTALKPGGILGVEEHRAVPGTSLQKMIDTGYVTETYVISRVTAAGFELDGKSEVNSNPRDTKDYPNGVWSLPPHLPRRRYRPCPFRGDRRIRSHDTQVRQTLSKSLQRSQGGAVTGNAFA